MRSGFLKLFGSGLVLALLALAAGGAFAHNSPSDYDDWWVEYDWIDYDEDECDCWLFPGWAGEPGSAWDEWLWHRVYAKVYPSSTLDAILEVHLAWTDGQGAKRYVTLARADKRGEGGMESLSVLIRKSHFWQDEPWPQLTGYLRVCVCAYEDTYGSYKLLYSVNDAYD